LGAFFHGHAAASDEQPLAHALSGKPGEELRHFGTLCSFSHGKLKKSAAVGQKRAMFLALWLF
jgi:hypothetical protein